jgi:hypothetical protein
VQLHKDVQGTYVGLRPTFATQLLLEAWAQEAGITLAENLHLTVLYSRVPLRVTTNPDEHRAEPVLYEPLGTSPLVVKFIAPSIVARHEQLIRQGGTHDFPEFIPHMTLVAEGDAPAEVPPMQFAMTFGMEYTEALRE